MTANAAIAGTYSDLKFIKSRKVAQVIVEIPIEQAGQFTAMFGTPNPAEEVWVGIARLVQPAATQPQPAPEGPRFNDMPRAKQAGILCGEPEFWRYLTERTGYAAAAAPDMAAEYVRFVCGVESRSHLDANREAAEQWDELRDAYRAWQRDIAAQQQAEAQAAAYGRR